MTIWKFPLKCEPTQEVKFPLNARLLSLQMQYGIPCIWANVNVDVKQINRMVYTFGTGQETNWITEQLDFVGTYQMGILVFHVFIDRERWEK